MTTSTDTPMGPQRVQAALDAILPDHAHRATSHAWLRFWTTAAGAFNIRTESDSPRPSVARHEIRFVEESRGWDIRVPCTAAGLDAVILAMLAADALNLETLRRLRDDARNAPSTPAMALRTGMIDKVLAASRP